MLLALHLNLHSGSSPYVDSNGFMITVTQAASQAVSGGFWPDYDQVRRQRQKRRREIEEAEEATRQLPDETDRQIATLLRVQEAKDAERADLERLQRLADRYAGQTLDLPKQARLAILNAQDARTVNALQQLQRVIEQLEEEELMAIQHALLLLD